MQNFDYPRYTFNSVKACFVTLEQLRSTRNDTFFFVLTKDTKDKVQFKKSKSFCTLMQHTTKSVCLV